MLKILYIDDDPHILLLTGRYLKQAGFQVTTASNYTNAMNVLQKDSWDLAIVDIMLPDESGLNLISHLRQKKIPVIMVTARSGMRDKTTAFAQGADDYLVKPFDPHELILRIQAVMRRVQMTQDSAGDPALMPHDICLGREEETSLRIDPDQQKVFVGNREVAVPRRELQLLSLLAQNANHTLTRDQIVEKIWGIDFEGDLRVVDLYIDRLRQRLHAKDEKPRVWALRTVRGLGYRLEVKR